MDTVMTRINYRTQEAKSFLSLNLSLTKEILGSKYSLEASVEPTTGFAEVEVMDKDGFIVNKSVPVKIATGVKIIGLGERNLSLGAELQIEFIEADYDDESGLEVYSVYL